ncbi:tetratricopeptide repeat-containing protein, partial [Chloroflexota bacterium]
MHVFIVRPFGTKNDIDFDRVEEKLIRPALEALEWAGGTTGEIIKQGNIREDMFEQLLIADLVIADITIHNANVFYELGIRHAFRDQRTFLIKSEGQDVPFDITTDRYFPYDSNTPENRLDDLITALKATAASSDPDSPVFQLLPDLEPSNPSKYLLVPLGFREAVEQAESKGELQLLSAETEGFSWKSSGLRLIGRAQFDLKDWPGARVTWNALRKLDPFDLEANIRLGTIYERLDELQNSEHALERAAENREILIADRAEILALWARNAKTRWERDWRDLENLDDLQKAALTSPYLERSLEHYLEGFEEDRNHFYSGLNALAMAAIMIELASAQPDTWEYSFDSEKDASRKLEDLAELRAELGIGVKLAVDSNLAKLKRQGETDPWAEISRADLALLSFTNPERVGLAYKRAVANVPDFVIESARKQIERYQKLGILQENTAKALEFVPKIDLEEETKAP